MGLGQHHVGREILEGLEELLRLVGILQRRTVIVDVVLLVA